jgi:hypothetical protein
VFSEIPLLKGKLAGIEAVDYLSRNVGAESVSIGGTIRLNKKFFSNYDEFIKECEHNYNLKFLVSRTPEELVIHEIGHSFAFFAKHDWTTDAGYKSMLKGDSIAEKIKNAVNKEIGKTDIGTQYADTNAEEWFAEAFTLYITGRRESEVVQSFGRQIEKIIKSRSK